jgi:phosphate transport system ATP-binding protein
VERGEGPSQPRGRRPVGRPAAAASTLRIEETIRELSKDITIIIVTHNMQQAVRVSDNTAFFLAAENEPGHVVEQGPTTEIFGNPQDQRTLDYVNGRFG